MMRERKRTASDVRQEFRRQQLVVNGLLPMGSTRAKVRSTPVNPLMDGRRYDQVKVAKAPKAGRKLKREVEYPYLIGEVIVEVGGDGDLAKTAASLADVGGKFGCA